MYRCQKKSSVFLLIYKYVEEGKKIDELIFQHVCFISLSFRNFPRVPVVKIAGSKGSTPGQGTKIPYATHKKPKTKTTTTKKTELQIAGLGFSLSLCLKAPEHQELSTCYDRTDEWMNDFRGIKVNTHPSDVSQLSWGQNIHHQLLYQKLSCPQKAVVSWGAVSSKLRAWLLGTCLLCMFTGQFIDLL